VDDIQERIQATDPLLGWRDHPEHPAQAMIPRDREAARRQMEALSDSLEDDGGGAT
jgi:hypothetical protein